MPEPRKQCSALFLPSVTRVSVSYALTPFQRTACFVQRHVVAMDSWIQARPRGASLTPSVFMFKLPQLGLPLRACSPNVPSGVVLPACASPTGALLGLGPWAGEAQLRQAASRF